jgi:hypothetical protein
MLQRCIFTFGICRRDSSPSVLPASSRSLSWESKILVLLLIISSPLLCIANPAAPKEPAVARGKNIYTWENVGEITQVNAKTFSIRRYVKFSDSSWSLEAGAVTTASQMQKGDQIVAKGKTQLDGTFETRRIYMISPAASRVQTEGGKSVAQGADYGGPVNKAPLGSRYPGDPGLEGRGRGYPGTESRVPVPGKPGGGGKGSPGGLQSSRTASFPRFAPGDAEGIIEQVESGQLILSQTFYFDKETPIHRADGGNAKSSELILGKRVAVTARDEIDQRTRAVKAAVVRLLP